MIVNVLKLDGELRTAGIPVDGVGFNGDGSCRIDYQASATPGQIQQGAAILAAHVPTLTQTQQLQTLGFDRLTIALALKLTTNPLTPTQAQWAQAVINNAATRVQGIVQ